MPSQRLSLANSSLPAEWKRRLAGELEEGEELLWAGQPDPTMTLVRSCQRMASIMVLLLFMLLFVVWMSWANIRQGQVGAMVLPGLLVFLIAIVLFLVLWHRRQAFRTCYALTDRRALVFLPSLVGKLRLENYFPEQLRQARFKRSWLFGPEAGDWVFRQKTTVKAKHFTSQGIRQPWRDEVSREVKSYGFVMLRQALAIEPLLRQVTRKQ